MTPPVNPDATARLVEALRAIVDWENREADYTIPVRLINDANNALHMAQLPVVPQTITERETAAHQAVMRDIDKAKKEYEILWVEKRFIPKGATLVECYETEKEFVIIGTPTEEADSDGNPIHNCDAMGCSTLSHVVARVSKKSSAPVVPVSEDVETIREALSRLDGHGYTAEGKDQIRAVASAALAALERVSALQAEMEAALDTLGENLREFNGFSNRFITILAALQVKRRESR